MFFPLTSPLDILVTTLAVVGFAACVARRHANGTALGVIGLLSVAAVYLIQEDGLPLIGLLWNPRLLPLLYFMRYLLMIIGIVELAGLLVAALRSRPAPTPSGLLAGSVTFAVAALSVLLVLGFMFEVLPGGGRRQSHDKVVYAWGPLRKTATGGDAQGDGWSRYNFSGYEGRTSYPEYYDVVTTMTDIGRTNGCGRALWENNEENGQYGTTMALMLLPHWTDGCIGSMEGLFFEASGTTPYHFCGSAPPRLPCRRTRPKGAILSAQRHIRKERARRRRRLSGRTKARPCSRPVARGDGSTRTSSRSRSTSSTSTPRSSTPSTTRSTRSRSRSSSRPRRPRRRSASGRGRRPRPRSRPTPCSSS